MARTLAPPVHDDLETSSTHPAARTDASKVSHHSIVIPGLPVILIHTGLLSSLMGYVCSMLLCKTSNDGFTSLAGAKDNQTHAALVDTAPRGDDAVDARVLGVTEDAHGQGHKSWRDVVAQSFVCQVDDHTMCSVDGSDLNAVVMAGQLCRQTN